MELEIVNFEQAKALKELGFPQEKMHMLYTINDQIVDCVDFDYIADGLKKGRCPDDVIHAPELELAAKWLRKEKKINVEVVEYINEDRPVDISYIINIHFNQNGYRHSIYIDTPLDDLIQKYSYESINWSDEQFDFYYNEMANHKYFIDYEEALSFGIDKAIEILTKEK